jgi:hypothetical protein
MREFEDDPSGKCELCGQWMPIVLLVEHMHGHGLDLRYEIVDAEIVDLTGEPT